MRVTTLKLTAAQVRDQWVTPHCPGGGILVDIHILMVWTLCTSFTFFWLKLELRGKMWNWHFFSNVMKILVLFCSKYNTKTDFVKYTILHSHIRCKAVYRQQSCCYVKSHESKIWCLLFTNQFIEVCFGFCSDKRYNKITKSTVCFNIRLQNIPLLNWLTKFPSPFWCDIL